MLYLVQWSGYKGTLDKYLWTPATNLENATELVSEFHSLYLGKPGPLTRLQNMTFQTSKPLLPVKTLNLTVEYAFQLEAYI